jgi:hypothetical protein
MACFCAYACQHAPVLAHFDRWQPHASRLIAIPFRPRRWETSHGGKLPGEGWSRCADTWLQKLLASVWFDLITVGAIFLNCVTLAMTDPLCEGTLPDNL